MKRIRKADLLTSAALGVFRLNGLLIDWGNRFGEPFGLTSARWQILGALALASHPLSAPQVGALMGVTRQGAQKQLNLLLTEGLVAARPNPMHKRSPLYALTANGRHAYDCIDQRWQQHVQELSWHFSAADLDAAIRVLATLSHAHSSAPETLHEIPS